MSTVEAAGLPAKHQRSWCPTCRGFLIGGYWFKGRTCGTCFTETVPEFARTSRPIEELRRIAANSRTLGAQAAVHLSAVALGFCKSESEARASLVAARGKAEALIAAIDDALRCDHV